MLSYKTILCPTDFSDQAEKTLKLALSLANGDSVLHLCHVLPPVTMAYGEVLTDLAAGGVEKTAREQLEAVVVPGDLKVQRHLVEGDPAKEICRLAGEVKADVIVLSSHGRTGLFRLLMGSVAEHVLRHAPCPVLVMKS